MPERRANAVWTGGLKDGSGFMKLGSGAYEGNYSFATRFGETPGTNPEELVGAAHAGCFSMALSGALGKAGFTPHRIATEARVHLTMGPAGATISRIDLDCEASIPDIEEAKFVEIAEGAKKNCPVSKALLGVEIVLSARLV
jgi:lipoyl-dependent peroxiredoxin